jgi:hypothetical protein
MFDHEALRAKNKWKYVNEVPNLPFNSFRELQDALSKGGFSINVSYIAARQFVPYTYSTFGRWGNLLLQSTPLFMILALIITAISLSNYLLLLLIPIPFISSFLSNPMNPARGFASLLNTVALVGLLVSYWRGYQSIFWLCAAFFLPFFANRLTYRFNVSALVDLLKTSEPLFLNQYEKRGLKLKDNRTGEEYWSD